ncbi:MAG: AMIN domain-containing protein [Sulfurimonas sp.]|nr:AMIN domain-containing protein [Sulfurimonas sp.]
MLRVLLVTFFLIFNLDARENPFFPSQGEEDLPFTSNETKNIPKLKQASITLPSTARIIKKVTIEYENLDASLETKSIDLTHTVDWHLPLFISQSYAKEKVINSKKIPTKHKKIQVYKEIGKIKFADFMLGKSRLKIITQDKLIRNFLLGQPHRIVMDFKRESSMNSYFKTIENSAYTKIRVGNHKGYYRIVIELDGYYRYKVKEIKDGYLISLQ